MPVGIMSGRIQVKIRTGRKKRKPGLETENTNQDIQTQLTHLVDRHAEPIIAILWLVFQIVVGLVLQYSMVTRNRTAILHHVQTVVFPEEYYEECDELYRTTSSQQPCRRYSEEESMSIVSLSCLMICHAVLGISRSSIINFFKRQRPRILENDELIRLQQNFLSLQAGDLIEGGWNWNTLQKEINEINSHPTALQSASQLHLDGVLFAIGAVLINYFDELAPYVHCRAIALPSLISLPYKLLWPRLKQHFIPNNSQLALWACEFLNQLDNDMGHFEVATVLKSQKSWDDVFIQVGQHNYLNSNSQKRSLQSFEALDDTCIEFTMPLQYIQMMSKRPAFIFQLKNLDIFTRTWQVSHNKTKVFTEKFKLRSQLIEIKAEAAKACKEAVKYKKIGKYMLVNASTNITLIIYHVQEKIRPLLTPFYCPREAAYLLKFTDDSQVKIFYQKLFPVSKQVTESVSEDSVDFYQQSGMEVNSNTTVTSRRLRPSAPPISRAQPQAEPQLVPMQPQHAPYTWNFNGQSVTSDDENVHEIIDESTNRRHPLYVYAHLKEGHCNRYHPLLYRRYRDVLLDPRMATARRGAQGIVSQDEILKIKFLGSLGNIRIISAKPIDSDVTRPGAQLYEFCDITCHD